MLHVCKSHGWAAVAVIGACMTMGGAQAAVITETAPVAGHQFVDPGQDVLVPNFDPALGTLTGASASLTGQFTPGVSFTTNSSTFPDFAVTFNPSVSFSGSVQFLALQGAGAQSTGDGNGQSIGTPGAVNITRSLSLGNLPTNPVFPGDLDFYIIGTSLTRLPPGAFFTQDLGVLTAQLAVTYTYTPGTAVPEPASLALLGAGLLGFCTVRSGMRRSASF